VRPPQRKPYRVVTFYSLNCDAIKEKLKAAHIEFSCRDVLNNFWGIEFTIYKPRGKGATAKCKIINEL
jgi:hypothetical protein